MRGAGRRGGGQLQRAGVLLGLECFGTYPTFICQKQYPPYCYGPAKCGDGICQGNEMQTCPQDCGGSYGD